MARSDRAAVVVSMPHRAVIILATSALCAVLSMGCRGGGERATPVSEPLPAAPAWESIRASQSMRLERMWPLRAGGAVELTWREGRSRRFETCRGELSLRSGLESALDLRKVGERFLWVGSDAERQWVFDLRRGEETAWIRARGAAWPGGGPPIPAEVDLADLFGLMAFDEVPLDGPIIEEDSRLVRFVLGPAQTPRVVRLDPETLLPVRIEMLDRRGSAIVKVELEHYGPVEREGLPPGARPRFPGRVRVRTIDAAEMDAGDGEIRLFLVPPEMPPRVPDRIFSLDALLDSFKPRMVHSDPG